MPQIGLVPYEHNDDVGLGVVPELLEPALHVLKGAVLGNVIDEQSTDGAAVVGGGDGTVTLLASRVPDLCLDGFALRLDGLGGELNSDGRLGFEVELIAGEPRQEVGLTDAGIADKDDLEKVIVFFVYSSSHVMQYYLPPSREAVVLSIYWQLQGILSTYM
mmetsp:Transcript_803/g.1763  ORF Transcript_803/g.1763 Transcript_803/m.1763 type:complete len:161 (-) Transcript_803:18-500(-)